MKHIATERERKSLGILVGRTSMNLSTQVRIKIELRLVPKSRGGD
jgi:hypothetical protein